MSEYHHHNHHNHHNHQNHDNDNLRVCRSLTGQVGLSSARAAKKHERRRRTNRSNVNMRRIKPIIEKKKICEKNTILLQPTSAYLKSNYWGLNLCGNWKANPIRSFVLQKPRDHYIKELIFVAQGIHSDL